MRDRQKRSHRTVETLKRFGSFDALRHLLAHLLAPVAKHIRQPGLRLALPKPNLRRVHPVSLRDPAQDRLPYHTIERGIVVAEGHRSAVDIATMLV